MVLSIFLISLSPVRKRNTFCFLCTWWLWKTFLLALMRISPADGIVEFNQQQSPMNLSCTVRELPSQTIDPSKLKWYHNKQEVNHKTHPHSLHKYPPHNQATLTLSIRRLPFNDTGLFQCIYDNGLLSRDVQVIPTSSGRAIAVFVVAVYHHLLSF